MSDNFKQTVADATARMSKRRHCRPYIKGPIPLDWITRAFQLRGKAGALGLAIWWKAGLAKRTSVLPCTSATAMRFGVTTRKGRMAALRQLEDAGLIRVTRYANRSPSVDIVVDIQIPVSENRS